MIFLHVGKSAVKIVYRKKPFYTRRAFTKFVKNNQPGRFLLSSNIENDDEDR